LNEKIKRKVLACSFEIPNNFEKILPVARIKDRTAAILTLTL
jgi:hypothetical protein